MSRQIDQLPDGTYHVEVYDWEGCRHLHNEVCCNDKCDMCFDFPNQEEDCKRCKCFEPEEKDGQQHVRNVNFTRKKNEKFRRK